MRLRPLVTLFVLVLGAGACTSAPQGGSAPPVSLPAAPLQAASVLVGGAGGPVLVQVPSGSVLFDAPGAVASLGGRWLVGASSADDGTLLETRDASTGAVVASERVAGRLDPRIVSE